MAETQILTNDPITRKRWAKDLFKVLLPEVEFNYLIGTGDTAIVQSRTELGKGEGDQITFPIRLPLTGDPIVGRDTVEGTEEELRFRDFKMTIEEINKAVNSGGKMEQQRIPFDLISESKAALQDYFADFFSEFLINTLMGNADYRVASQVFGQAPDAPDVGHYLAVNQDSGTVVATAEAALTSADVIDLHFLDRMKQLAELPYGTNDQGYFKVRPLKLGGKNKYRVIMHNYAFDQLRQNTNVAQWGDILRQAQKLQMPEVEIEYNGMLISKSERVPQTVQDSGNAGVYRIILLGAQSACWAWGGAGENKSTTMGFVPYEADAKRYLNFRGESIFGMKKTRFNTTKGDATTAKDYGMITGSAYAAPIS